MNLSSQDAMIYKSANYGSREMNGYNVRFKGNNVVNYIAWQEKFGGLRRWILYSWIVCHHHV